jgi:hypothetical protein
MTRRLLPPWVAFLFAAHALADSPATVPAAHPYVWRNVRIVGGGFVTGIIPRPAPRGLMYAKSDIGGAYRRGAADQSRVPLLDWVDQQRWTYTGIESLAN